MFGRLIIRTVAALAAIAAVAVSAHLAGIAVVPQCQSARCEVLVSDRAGFLAIGFNGIRPYLIAEWPSGLGR